MGVREPRGRDAGAASAVLLGALALVASTTGTAGPESVGLAVLLVVGNRGRALGGLVTAIVTGALVLGGLSWLAATQTGALPLSDVVAAGLGLAVGGGLGSVVWLLAFGEEETDSSETVTVDMAEDADQAPDPEPVDLFEASPDPILFYTEAESGPVVRAVNPAFQRVFGVTGTALDGVPLREGTLVDDRAEDVVVAAREGRLLDEIVSCETDDGLRPMRVRIAATGRERTDGYVLYTPVEDET